MKKLGVDTGGTFTDFVYSDGVRLRVHKVLSTPDAPERAILQGVEEMGLSLENLLIVHGSTVATNTVLEGKGVRTAYITNRGFADVLTIGRQARRELYNLQPRPKPPPVPRALCLETGGRITAEGEVLDPLTDEDLEALRQNIVALQPDAVAINLLFSFLDDRAEARIAEIMPDDLFVSRSSLVLNEYREYERGMATWLNAYVGPLMQRYLDALVTRLDPAVVMVMQSHGGTIAAKNAGAKAVELLLSGPAGGLVGAQYQGNASGVPRMMSFDMGGTSTDVALIDGEIQLTSEAEIAGYPVAVSMVDMHTIGAGGGSIAWLDEGDMLQVGPQSAGADPGPACYGRGGHLPTVTDANLILGRLPMETSLGGHLALDFAAAQTAVAGLAREMGIETETAAAGILQVANELMAQALRVISVQRGHDPREFALLSFGGAGGLQVCELAERLGMKHAIVPLHGGVLSALGMLVAPVARQRSQTRIQILSADSMAGLEADFQRLENSLRTEMREEGAAEVQLERSVDLRYQGQSSTLSLPWFEHAEHLAEALHQRHQDQFGHALAMPVELVNLRVRAEVTSTPFHLPVEHAAHSARPLSTTSVFGIEQAVPVYARSGLSAQQRLNGPAIIAEEVSTTWLAPGWNAVNDTAGNLILRQA